MLELVLVLAALIIDLALVETIIRLRATVIRSQWETDVKIRKLEESCHHDLDTTSIRERP